MEQSNEKYNSYEFYADDICYCGHRRDRHDYSKTESIAPSRSCLECACCSWNITTKSELLGDWQRLYRRIFKGEKPKMVTCTSLRIQPFTKEEIENIKMEFGVK